MLALTSWKFSTSLGKKSSLVNPSLGSLKLPVGQGIWPAFWMLGEADSGALWIGRWTGASPWERHANGDELLHQLEGEVKITLLLDEGEKVVHLKAGEIFLVPKGAWHKQESVGEEKTVQWGKTPMPTDHSDADDPRDAG